jgi:ribosomal protein L40E
MIAILGAWCEGEMRTGKPWPAVVRLYWHQGAVRCRQELQRLVEGRGSSWRLPPTATEEERLLASVESPLPQGQGLVALCTQRPAMEGWLADACRRCGYSTVWLNPQSPTKVRGAAAVIYEGSEGTPTELDEIRRFATELAPAPLVAILDFPRIEVDHLARQAGAAAVLSKPVQVDDLLWTLAAVR